MSYEISNLYLDLVQRDFSLPIFKQRKYIVVHHSLTPDKGLKTWDQIRTFHMSWRCNGDIVTEQQGIELIAEGKRVEKPDLDIGYNYGVSSEKGQLEFLRGRDLSMTGAHALGFNNIGIGICVVGNYDLVRPDKARWDMAALACMYLRKVWYDRLGINLKVIGHRETYPILGKPVEKSCPGNLWSMDLFRKTVYGELTSEQVYGQ